MVKSLGFRLLLALLPLLFSSAQSGAMGTHQFRIRMISINGDKIILEDKDRGRFSISRNALDKDEISQLPVGGKKFVEMAITTEQFKQINFEPSKKDLTK